MKFILLNLFSMPSFFKRSKQCLSLWTLACALSGSVSAQVPTCSNAFEPNETITTAAVLNPNTRIDAAIATATDQDFYKIDLVSGQIFQLSLINVPADFNLELYNSVGTRLAFSTNSDLSSESISYKVLVTDRYFVRVFGADGHFSNTLCYTLENSIVNTGITGPSCVTPGQTYSYTVNPELTTSTTVNWYTNSSASVMIDPRDSKHATLTIPVYLTSGTFTLTAGVNFSAFPYYKEYTKSITVGGCVGSRTTLSVSPQPFDESTILSAEGRQLISVTVYDAKGQEVYKAENIMQDRFELGNELAAGMYVVQVITEDGVSTTRMIKSK